MFGKTKELSDVEEHPANAEGIDEFFGDESGVAEAVRVDHLQQRVTQVEQQINSQFTSLAAYAQIAQEQVELVRSEAQHGKERSEQRVIELIERERADRLASSTGSPTGAAIDIAARLDTLDAQIGELREGLQQCMSNQKALADAITDLFAPITEAPGPDATPAPAPMPSPLDAPAAASMPSPMPTPVPAAVPAATVDMLPPPPSFDAPATPDASTVGFESPALPTPDLAPDFSSAEPDADPASPIEPVGLPALGLVDGPIDGLSLN